MVNVFSTLRSNTKPILGDQPSIFEVQYPSSLSTSLHKATKFIIKILALLKNEWKYKILNRNFEEFYLIFNVLLNYFYLKQYGSSFFEHFYGIKRVFNKTGMVPKGNVEIIRSLFQIVLLPYILTKINEWKSKASEISSNNRSKWANFVLKAWPYINKFILALSIILQALYLFNYSPIHSIEMLLAGVFYQKYSTIDLKLMESRKISFNSSSFVGKIMNLIVGLISKFGKILSYILIAIQVLNYVQEATDSTTNNILNIFKGNINGERKSNIEFPIQKLSDAEAMNLSKDQCPLCLKKKRK